MDADPPVAHFGFRLTDPAAIEQAAKLVTISQVIYGVAGSLAAAALVMRSRWAKPLRFVWAPFASLTAGLAPVVWGDAPLTAGVVSALAGAAICAGVIVLAVPRRQPVT